MADPWQYADGLSNLGRAGRMITPGATDLDPVPKAIVCVTDGNVTFVPVDNADGGTLTIAGTVGFIPPYRIRRVTAATGTWATIE